MNWEEGSEEIGLVHGGRKSRGKAIPLEEQLYQSNSSRTYATVRRRLLKKLQNVSPFTPDSTTTQPQCNRKGSQKKDLQDTDMFSF
jgi:hypothetical protein